MQRLFRADVSRRPQDRLGAADAIFQTGAVVGQQFLSGCLIVLTFGLFLLVVNAAMLLLSSWLAGQLGIGFHVDGWWPALLGSIVISIVSGAINGVTGATREVA